MNFASPINARCSQGGHAQSRMADPAHPGQGRIVFISTGVTRHGMIGASAYAAAKAGLEGLVAVLK